MKDIEDRLVGDFETPVPVIDLARAERNARRVVEYLARHGIAWRPHVKTHKSLGIARIQLEAGARGLTVATPREAEVMSQVCDDLLLAYPPLGRSKLSRLMRLPERVRLTVGLDSSTALGGLSEAAEAAGREVGILVELDVGLGRVGVADARDVVRLAEMAAGLPGVHYRGIMFYPGHLRMESEAQGDGLAALRTRLEAVYAELEREGYPPAVVSGGSTPTLWRSHEIPGLTEVRAGTIIFNDRDILAMGACRTEDLAYSVAATVVSTAVPGHAVLDAGSKALAKEPFRSGGTGFGFVLEHPEVVVASLSEEHGVLDLAGSDWRPRVGEQVRVIPNHVCVSVNLQDHYLVDRGEAGDGSVPSRPTPEEPGAPPASLEVWPIEARGRGPWPG